MKFSSQLKWRMLSWSSKASDGIFPLKIDDDNNAGLFLYVFIELISFGQGMVIFVFVILK